MQIEHLDATRAWVVLPQLIDILEDAVASGASIGFVPPLAANEARAYWEAVIADVAAGHRLVLVATVDGVICGTIQLDLTQRAN
ncbi:MAG TPA: GNAT family N-acetyltransferase, partial [Roseiflexaceae bacterium]|nr:GNAT family N-acetyltransferase [Roseiflexaceae bacterium]